MDVLGWRPNDPNDPENTCPYCGKKGMKRVEHECVRQPKNIEIGKPLREHEIERTPMTVPQPITVPERREVELPDPAVNPEKVPEKVPA